MSFDHRAHLCLAWEALDRGGLPAALIEIPAWLRGMATAAGKPEKYNETVTLGFLLLLADRHRPGEAFDAFLDRNPDLLRSDVLQRWWRAETLTSERARRAFVFPDQFAETA
ncbi:MAG: hypothetical protein H6738_22540 [Alphaproteobacteria bacterium]|nr:hypothetical protein [Alphaproteobacteria bacterium]MCB9699580.1 hypothetical protein [Alphaproteobacteria bacterium]